MSCGRASSFSSIRVAASVECDVPSDDRALGVHRDGDANGGGGGGESEHVVRRRACR